MSTIEKIIISYVIIINVITLIMYGIDKWKAQHSKWRIPEATLLIMAGIGGSIGALSGMIFFTIKRCIRNSTSVFRQCYCYK